MSTVTETVRLPAPHDTVAAKILRAVGKLPLQIFLAATLSWGRGTTTGSACATTRPPSGSGGC